MFCVVSGRCHGRDPPASIDQRARTDQPTGSSSTGGGSGGAGTSLTGGAAATSSTRRPSSRISGVPHRLHDMTSPNSDHFQHVGQQTFITTAHSQQRRDVNPLPCADGAETVTGSAQTGADPGIGTFPGHEPLPPRRGRSRSSAPGGLQQPARCDPTDGDDHAITDILTIGYRNSRHHAFAGALDSRSPDGNRAPPGVGHLHLAQRRMGARADTLRWLIVPPAGDHC